MKRGPQGRYSKEFREEAVKLVTEERLSVPDSFTGRTILSLNLKKHGDVLLLAVKTGEGWVYNPSDDYIIPSKSSFIFMTTPEGRNELERTIKNQ